MALSLEVPVMICYFSIFPFGNIGQSEIQNENNFKLLYSIFLHFDRKRIKNIYSVRGYHVFFQDFFFDLIVYNYSDKRKCDAIFDIYHYCVENNVSINFFCNNDSLMITLKCVEFPILITLENANANVMVNIQKHKFLSKVT